MTKVLACIDGAAGTASVCDYAAWAAVRLGAPLEFLHVIDRHPETAPIHDFSGSIGMGAQESLLEELSMLDEQRSRLAQEHGRQILQGARQRGVDAGVREIDVRQRHGALVDTLLELEHETRLFVLGQHPHVEHVGRRHLDHNVERVIRAVRRPVLVAAGAFSPVRRFVVAFDASATARRMIEILARSPLLQGLDCALVIAGDETEARRDALQEAQAALGVAGFDARTAHVSGEPEEALNQYVRDHDADLLVMGAYGHSRIRHLVVGSTTTALLRTSRVPVLILR
jgi:nucleotide-binding universal stress UspA family protein